ncbi:hypothetical protein AHAS_Ahas01G0163100 [Arachis hypogaea]
MAASEKNREGIPNMHVTHCDLQASMFVVEELDSFECWSQGSFRVWLAASTCYCGLFQSLHYPCRHALAAYAAASIEWAPYVHSIYRQEVVLLKVYEMEFPSISDKALWSEWHGTLLHPNPIMYRKATGRLVWNF